MMTNDFLNVEQAWECAEQSEITLLHSAQAGNLESFNALVLKYQDVMYRTALRILEQASLAEDATQDAFISAYQHLNGFRGGSFKAWLLRIVVNKSFDEVRRTQWSTARSFSESTFEDRGNEESCTWLRDPAPSVEECVETSEWTEHIQECLDELAIDHRLIIILIDIEEMSYGEVSTILNIPIGTVKSRLARARVNLRRELKAGEIF
jgi:RNA polymerase sigma-70 factor (ECF subfamily)